MRNEKCCAVNGVIKMLGKLRSLSFIIYHLSFRPKVAILSFIIFHLSFSSIAAQKIGLVLGGGGAKGGAEVGVLKVLEAAGVKPDYIVGTSIGSIVGGLYAAGYKAAELEQMFCEQEWLTLITDRRDDLSFTPYCQKDGIVYIFGFPVLDKGNTSFGVLRGERVEQTLDSMLALKGCTRFRSLPTPFRCVAASLMDAEEVVLSKGKLARAIRASMAIPGIFKPVDIEGMSLVDGGMMNNLPVDVCREMGADIIIAVDLQQEKPENRPQKDNFIMGIADMLGLGALVKWVFSRPDITKYNDNRSKCDIYINPPLPDYDASSFGNENMRRMISVGEQTARQQLPAIRRLQLPQR